ncbi:Hyphally regulated cell wall protein 3, partial [Candida tropicalis]
MTLLRNTFITLWFLIHTILAIDITSDRIDRGTVQFELSDITIHSGASWSIINNGRSILRGDLTVESDAGFYITSTSSIVSLQVSLASLFGSIKNDGIISFDSSSSLTSSDYTLVGGSFVNNGEIYMGASGIISGTLTGSMAITSADWTNNGLIVFYQNQRSSGNVNLGTPLGKITNDGQICLYNQVYRQLTEIQGSGCITADEDSTIYIGNGLLGISTTHNFYLHDSDSSLVAPAISTSQTFNVYGFGNGNKIGLSLPLVGSVLPLRAAYSYDADTGILTLRNILLTQYFNIGLGYDSSLFQIVTDSGAGIPSTILGSVRYNGPVPERTLPAACQIECKKAREAPGVEPTEYLTTVTSTLSDGSVTTESGIVDETTDSQ